MTYTFPRLSISTPLHGPSVISAGNLRNPSTGRKSIGSSDGELPAHSNQKTAAIATTGFGILVLLSGHIFERLLEINILDAGLLGHRVFPSSVLPGPAAGRRRLPYSILISNVV